MKPFWLPVIATSTPQSSIRKSIDPMEETPSTNSIAGCPAASIARRTAATSDRTPVAVSLCVASTALMACPLSAVRISSNRAASIPSPQAASTTSTSIPKRWHMSIQRCENMPFRQASTRSPALSVLAIAASQAPVPVAGKKNTSPVSVLRTFFTPDSAGWRMSAKSDERWSSVGMSTALRSTSGMFVGPGMKTGFWNDMGEVLPMISAPLLRLARLERNFFEMDFPFDEKSVFPSISGP